MRATNDLDPVRLTEGVSWQDQYVLHRTNDRYDFAAAFKEVGVAIPSTAQRSHSSMSSFRDNTAWYRTHYCGNKTFQCRGLLFLCFEVEPGKSSSDLFSVACSR